MPKRLNHNENGMHWSARLRKSREKEELQKHKAHTVYGTAAATKVAFGEFSLLHLGSSVIMPKQQTNLDMTLTEQAMNRFHEVNELYDGKINKIHHLFYLTNKTTIETFTFCESMKQEDRRSFVNAMKK